MELPVEKLGEVTDSDIRVNGDILGNISANGNMSYDTVIEKEMASIVEA